MGVRANQLEFSHSYLEMAEIKIKCADLLLVKNFYADAISRSYYAAYLSAQAVLILLGEEPKTDQESLQLFSLKLVKTQIVKPRYAKNFQWLMNAWQESDHNPLNWFVEEDAQNALKQAKTFLARMKTLHTQLSSQDHKN